MDLLPFPADAKRSTSRLVLRFEDVTQDGRLVLESLPSAVGLALWHGKEHHESVPPSFSAEGILPILSRFCLASYDGPISANEAVEVVGTFRLAEVEDRFTLDVWTDLYGVIGRTHGQVSGETRAGKREGDRVLVARVFAEHVLTRPFAAPDQRRVTNLDFLKRSTPTPARAPLTAPADLRTLPEGAKWLEPSEAIDPSTTVFGLVHTDSNMHVNSLVYFRVFEEAALRRFRELKLSTALLGRELEIVYRKPCFAGDSVCVVQRAFEHDGRLGIASALYRESDTASEATLATAKPHSYARMMFDGA
jgi:hypothetical protein